MVAVVGSGPAADQQLSTTANNIRTAGGEHGLTATWHLPPWIWKGVGSSPRGHIMPWEHAGTLPLVSAGGPTVAPSSGNHTLGENLAHR